MYICFRYEEFASNSRKAQHSGDFVDYGMSYLIGTTTDGLPKLLPNKAYKVWIVARTDSPLESESEMVTFTTFEQPNLVTIVPESLKPRSMIVEWTSPNQDNIKEHKIIMLPKEEYTKFTSTTPRYG